jgi:multiple sugar transport system ATP-binding protein
VLGLCPEAIFDEARGADTTPLRARVELSELMGSETNVYLKTGAGTFIARLHTERRFAVGEELTVHLALAKAHLFDAKTEQVIK